MGTIPHGGFSPVLITRKWVSRSSTGIRGRQTAVSFLLLWGLSLFLYGDSLNLPFFFDDIIHMRWLDWHSLPEIWETALGLAYYRPLVFSVWKLSHILLGSNSPAGFHALNLLFHLANVALVYLLAQRVAGGSAPLAFVAGVLFAVYPFNYATVPWVGAFHYPLATFLLLAGLLLYWEGRARERGTLLAASWIMLFLAPFAVQSAVMGWALVLATEILGAPRREFGYRLKAIAPFLVGNVLYLMVWSQIPKDSTPHLQPLEPLWQSGNYYLQGLLFPVSASATVIQRQWGVSDMTALAVIWAVALPAAFAWFQWHKEVALASFSMVWFTSALLVPWLFLPFSYVVDGPRLFYLASVGSALLWAGTIILLGRKMPTPRRGQLLTSILLLVIAWRSSSFIVERTELYQIGAGLTRALLLAAAGAGQAESLLVVNFPGSLAPKEATYVLGHEGVTLVASYYRMQDFIYVNSGLERRAWAVTFPDTQRAWKHLHGFLGPVVDWNMLSEAIHQADYVYSTDFLPESLRLREAGRLLPQSRLSAPPRAVFAAAIVLEDARVVVSERELDLSLTWHAIQTPHADVTAFLHVYDSSGRLVLGQDGYPLLQLFPFRLWQAGDRVEDRRYLSLPPDLPAGAYTVALGLYDRTSGERLAGFDPKGIRYPEDAVILHRLEQE